MFGLLGSVSWKNSWSDENVLPIPVCGGRKNTPFRKMLNELKNENVSKFAPTVNVWLPRKKLRLSVSCQTSWSRML